MRHHLIGVVKQAADPLQNVGELQPTLYDANAKRTTRVIAGDPMAYSKTIKSSLRQGVAGDTGFRKRYSYADATRHIGRNGGRPRCSHAQSTVPGVDTTDH